MRTRPHGAGETETESLPVRPHKTNRRSAPNHGHKEYHNKQAHPEGTRAGRGNGRVTRGLRGAGAAHHFSRITAPRRATEEGNIATWRWQRFKLGHPSNPTGGSGGSIIGRNQGLPTQHRGAWISAISPTQSQGFGAHSEGAGITNNTHKRAANGASERHKPAGPFLYPPAPAARPDARLRMSSAPRQSQAPSQTSSGCQQAGRWLQ